MEQEPRQVINRELAPTEKLLWAGTPRKGVLFRPMDAFLIPFSILWCGFAIFWETAAISGGPIFFALFGIPFVVVGLYFVFGRFVVDAWQRSKTFYGVRNERIIIVSGLLNRNVETHNLRTLSNIGFAERAGGVGTITFGTPMPERFAVGVWWPGGRPYGMPCLEYIDGAPDVYATIVRAQKEAYASNLPS